MLPCHRRSPKWRLLPPRLLTHAASIVCCCVAAGLAGPFIVKPRVACGVAHSHSMALVLSSAGLQQLGGQVPVPALVQEFVNHGGQQYKVYVMGEQVGAGDAEGQR